MCFLKLPLQSELKEISVTIQPEPVQPALPVVDFQAPLVCRVPVGANTPALELTALDLAVSKIRIRVTEREFDGPLAALAPADGVVGCYLVEKTTLAAIGPGFPGEYP